MTNDLRVVGGDVFRLAADVLLHCLILAPAAGLFVWLWASGSFWLRLIAIPGAWAAATIVSPVVFALAGLIMVRKVQEGEVDINSSEALPWIVGQSLLLIVQRSPFGRYIKDFCLPRHVFYRALGAETHWTMFLGGGASMLDPWALEVGRNVTIGACSLVSGHTIEGDKLSVKKVRIGDGATIGMLSVILPGVSIGEGAIVGAGAVVTKDVPPFEKWAGVPAVKIGVVAPKDRQGTEP